MTRSREPSIVLYAAAKLQGIIPLEQREPPGFDRSEGISNFLLEPSQHALEPLWARSGAAILPNILAMMPSHVFRSASVLIAGQLIDAVLLNLGPMSALRMGIRDEYLRELRNQNAAGPAIRRSKCY